MNSSDALRVSRPCLRRSSVIHNVIRKEQRSTPTQFNASLRDDMKQPPPGTAERVAKMTFASIYPLYVAKIEKKGRTEQELHEVIRWLTGYDEKKLQSMIDDDVTFETFFKKCRLNANAHLITGVICGSRVEEIEDPFMKKCRYLDKLIDELAKGRKMEKILRSA